MKKTNAKKIQILAVLLGLIIITSGCAIGESEDPGVANSSLSEQEATDESSLSEQKNTNESSLSEQEAADEPSSSQVEAEQPPYNADNIAVKNVGTYTTSYEYALADTDASWDKNKATKIALNGNTADISGSGASFSGGTLTIKQAGIYALSGTLSNGQVIIDAGKDDIVRLILDGVSLHCENAPAIYAPKSEKVELILEKGTNNKISDGAAYKDANNADAPDAVIFAQDNLSIAGEGSLTVTGAHNHGIRAQDDLIITGGVISVNSVGDALRGRDGVVIQNGNFTLAAGGDGIQSNNDEDDAKGFVIIDGGVFSIKSANDGIQAQSSLTVTGGTFEITTGGGSANAPVREEEFPGGRGGWFGWGSAQNSGTTTAEENSVSMKALKAGKQIVIAGGDFTIDAEDDAVHSNDTLLVTAGKLSVKTGDDGFHADAALQISGGEIDIPVCYEGIEGLSVTIGGGNITVAANDDAVNAAGGVDNASQAGGPMGRDSFAANGDIFVRITGGNLDLLAPRDGIDANGDIFIEGGTIKVSGPSQGMEGAIELDGSVYVTGGEFITAGSVTNVSSESTQPVILVSYTQQQAKGSIISIKDTNGNTLLEYTSRNVYSMSGFTSPSFKIGETYSVFIDGEKKTDITLNAGVTSVGEGGAYNGGRGGRRGR